MRKTVCKYRGPIALIRKGSGHVVGTAVLTDSKSPLPDTAAYAAAELLHCIPPARQQRAFADGWRTPWVLTSARALTNPVRYNHPNGAVIWVKLDQEVAAQVRSNSL